MENNIKIMIPGSEAILTDTKKYYNYSFGKRIRSMKDIKWNKEKKYWSFPRTRIEDVREILRETYGYDDTCKNIETVRLKLTIKNRIRTKLEYICILGKVLCGTSLYEKHAFCGDDVTYLTGKPKKTQYRNIWFAIVPEDSVILLDNVSKNLYDQYMKDNTSEDIEIEIVE